MAGRISCGLNLPLLDTNSAQSSSPLLKTRSQISWKRTEDETEPRKNKRSPLVLGVAATIVIGAVHITDVATVEAAVVESTVKEVAAGSVPPRRWSDKRACPPWLQNSLETIVPENLPRPSGHRRLELAGLAKGDAPPIGAVVTRVNRAACFSV
ncbi:unnamed protein product [Arabis nemorensis]|uniref:Uncharacterized protein n=1 Tax=Arabis nemorensis TaxID=586526 RepID=A0A565C5S7_9BRAS|nr:unnamed protein product [Arabis nemorensis]